MNDEKQDDLPVSETDRQIFDYLDDMLHDPAAGQPVSVQPELSLVIPDNVAHFDISKRKAPLSLPLKKAPQAKLPEQRTAPKEAKPLSLIERPALLSESILRVPVEESVKETAKKHDQTPLPPVTPKVEPAVPAHQEEATPSPLAHPVIKPEASELVERGPTELRPWCENGRPEWAQSRFECLIFTVNGLKLAVPLILLGSIHQIDRKFNALPGQYDWFIGILQTPNSGNIKVLDTALCVMPERHDPASRDSLEYVITIHGYSWGLACHRVEQSITLEPDQVKWRTQRGKRPWLAGTVLEHMCSLVDTDGFQEIINQAEQTL